MRLAFISDIHGNLPALKAVLAEIALSQPDNIYCLGDLVNFAGWDNEVITLIQQNRITTIQGNHDEGIGYLRRDFPFSYKTPAQKEFGKQSLRLVQKSLTPRHLAYLRSLPFMVRLEFRFPYHLRCLALVHGSPLSNQDYIRPESSDEELKLMMETAGADVLLMGHTHQPFHRIVYCEQENQKIYGHAINVGSVGKPKDGTPDACYVLLDINEETPLSDPASLSVSFHHVPYNTEKVIAHIHAAGLGDAYDDFIRNGED